MATAKTMAKAKDNPNALPDRIELLLDDNYATRMVSDSHRPSPNPSPNPNPGPNPGPSPGPNPGPSPSPSPNSNPGQLCGSSTYDEVSTAAGTDAVVGDAFGLDGRVGAPLLRLSTPSPPSFSSPFISLTFHPHLPPPPASRARFHSHSGFGVDVGVGVGVSVGVGASADIDVAPGACGAGPAHLRCAMRHLLCKYRFVGMTSRLNESACVLNSLFGWMQRPVAHSHETNSRADRVPNSAPASPSPGPSQAPSLGPGPKPKPKPRPNPPQAPPDFMKYHAGLVQYDRQLVALGAALFEETLDRFPKCRAKGTPRPGRKATTVARDEALSAAGIQLSEATACGWKP